MLAQAFHVANFKMSTLGKIKCLADGYKIGIGKDILIDKRPALLRQRYRAQADAMIHEKAAWL